MSERRHALPAADADSMDGECVPGNLGRDSDIQRMTADKKTPDPPEQPLRQRQGRLTSQSKSTSRSDVAEPVRRVHRLQASEQLLAKPLRNWRQRLAKLWVATLTVVSTTLLSSVVSILFGLQAPPAAIPLFQLVREQAALCVVVGMFLVGLTVASVLVLRSKKDNGDQRAHKPDAPHKRPRLVVALIVTSSVSTSSVVGLTTVVLTRPSWCPVSLCPAPPMPPGPHDEFLEAAVTTLASSTYALDRPPSAYSLSDLPPTGTASSVAAQRVVTTGPQGAGDYRVVLRVHSLQTGRFGLIIEEVGLRLTSTTIPPDPLNVWFKGPPMSFDVNPYRAMYSGQTAGQDMVTVHGGAVPEGHVQLAPGESDELSISVSSPAPAVISYRPAIRYRVADESQTRELLLPNVIRVEFSDYLNWHQYTLSSGRFVPA